MDFSWSEEQLEFHRAVAEFARRELNRDVPSRDRTARFPAEEWQECANFGLLGLCVPQEFGGSGLDVLSAVYALEGLGYGCDDNGLIFALNAQMWSVQAPILRFGSDVQKASYLRQLVRGDLIGAHGMTEPDCGSDAFAQTTRAQKRQGSYLLHGTKTFVSNAPVADLFLVFATVAPERGFFGVTAFLIEKDTAGLSVSAPIEKMGLRSAPMAEVVLDGCEVPAKQRLGAEGNGGSIFLHSMGWERCCILASHVGAMRRQIEKCVKHATTRKQFDHPIADFQAVSHRIAEMKVRFDSARLLLYRAAWLRSVGREATAEVAIAKLALSEAYVRNSLDAIQIHGGYGYTTEYGLERELRDAVAGRIYSGTSEIQKELIARELGL